VKEDTELFFREATLRICGTLDIEKALQRCLLFVQDYVPASRMVLSVYDHSTNIAEIVAHATLERAWSVSVKFPYTPRIKSDMDRRRKRSERIWRVRRFGDYEGTRKQARDMGLEEHPGLLMDLVLDDEFIGMLTIVHEPDTVYTEQHLGLLRLLNEPFAIALSNYMRYRKIQDLQDLTSDNVRYLQEELHRASGGDVVGADFGLRHVMEMVERVARQDSPVLLLGETGAGKEVVANVIHRLSHRRDRPFIGVNCGAIPDSLMDSELFGHEEGAFTGASFRKRGRFERAQGGTVFLDEIGELNLKAQVRLLRVLQEKQIERVGGTETIKVDIRVIAATHNDLEAMMRDGRFREDLYFRLKVFPITIPPLRDRVIDIPALVSYFIHKKTLEMKIGSPPTLAPGQIDLLTSYPWPGNVRELENAVERALILCDGSPLAFDDIIGRGARREAPARDDAGEAPVNLQEATAAHIRRILHAAGGRISGPGGAAQQLGIHPMTLRHRMKRLGIPFGRKARHLYARTPGT